MGAWDTGPFDNDHAADFATGVQGASGPGARQDMFAITFGAFTDMPEEIVTDTLEAGSELPAIFEEVIASAAYVVDAITMRNEFTDSVYARGLDDDDEVAPHVNVGSPSPQLVSAAHVAMIRVVRLMNRAGIDLAWTDYPERITRALEDRL
jgi:hypothetical protein